MKARTFTLEALLTGREAFALESASPLQRAICRVADGLPLGELAACEDVKRAIGDVSALPAGALPAELYILSGIRTGKSLVSAALAVRAALTCDLSKLGPGETARVSVLSLTVDLGRVVFGHLAGTVTAKPALKALVVGEPTGDAIELRHPSGRVVEVKVVAGARAGASLVARWSAGCIFDEAPRMLGEEDGVVNFDDARRAVLGRLLPGAQLVAIGSPWAPRGPIYEAVLESWGKPSVRRVVVRAAAPAMNPVWWTPERVEALKAQDEQAYRTDVLGEFADPDSSLVSSSEIERATRKGPLVLERMAGDEPVAAMDPGTRGNAWTLVIASRRRRADGRAFTCVLLAKQWQGSKADPLDPDKVLAEVARLLRGYRVGGVETDQLAADFVRSIAARHSLDVHVRTITAPVKLELFESMRMRMADDGIEIPDDPTLRADLLSIRKRVTMNGISIELPRTADGRHADYAPALALAVARARADPPIPPRALTVNEQEEARVSAAIAARNASTASLLSTMRERNRLGARR
ncbi:MAG TPA: hypothetical protein VK841_06885 [Polyangiaceae bacterium]|jgi:hypothetical protein|nr:hypothetical protein [Polyangiaceae bacterium]